MTESRFKTPVMRMALLMICCSLLVTMIGCDAFVRKFTRKSKKEKLPAEEMVLAPEEYKGPRLSKEELYRQYFLYWKSWHDELIESLHLGANHKKQIGSVNEAIKNLQQLRQMLKEEKIKRLDIYLGRMNALKDAVTLDVYGDERTINRTEAERIRRGILRDFSYPKVKDSLI